LKAFNIQQIPCGNRNTASTMSVLLETSAGDIVIDLLVDYAPKMCEK